MKINIELKDYQGNPVSGFVQLNDTVDVIENGIADFNVDLGEYIIRIACNGFQGKTERINVQYEGQTFSYILI